MEFIIVLVIFYFAKSFLNEIFNGGTSSPSSLDNSYSQKSTLSSQPTSRRDYSYTEAEMLNNINITGKSRFILSDNEYNRLYTFFMEGQHSMADSRYTISYDIFIHEDSSKNKKAYMTNVQFNHTAIHEKITNKKSASSVLEKMVRLSNDGVLKEVNGGVIGVNFLEECARMITFNQYNGSKNMFQYIRFTDQELEHFLTTASDFLAKTVDEIADMTTENLNEESDYSSNDIPSNHFDIYLKILGFKSGNGISYEDIKNQYRKAAKKYHPDAEAGDAERFKLIQDSYDYLIKHYPH